MINSQSVSMSPQKFIDSIHVCLRRAKHVWVWLHATLIHPTNKLAWLHVCLQTALHISYKWART